jgi:hypothetical protein
MTAAFCMSASDPLPWVARLQIRVLNDRICAETVTLASTVDGPQPLRSSHSRAK